MQIKEIASGFAAGFFAYVCVGSLLGVSLATRPTDTPDCMPQWAMFWAIETRCDSAFAEALWFGAADLPRLALVPPTIAVNFFYGAFKNSTVSNYFLEGVWWTIVSTPFLLVAWLGFRHWRTVSPIAAWMLLTLFVGQIGIVGLD